jgi:hypothetical protein
VTTFAQGLAGSGAILGGVLVLLAQQLGAIPLSETWPTLLWFLSATISGGAAFGLLALLIDEG